MTDMTLFPSEWHQQEFVQLTWPHADTDWAPMLDEVYECYRNMAREIALREPLLIVALHPEEVREQLSSLFPSVPFPIHIIYSPNNDTWARDHAFITVFARGRRRLLDYQFNGWGMKFPANLDNQINKNIFNSIKQRFTDMEYHPCLDFVLEGGSIESDGQGTLLTTASCLLAPHRNDSLTREQIEQRLLDDLHVRRILWLHHGHLAGDDTDGHIDTLARLCPNDTIAYVQCTDRHDEQAGELRKMEAELQAFRTLDGRPYRLVPLPLPDPVFEEDFEANDHLHTSKPKRHRLPATYANFLIVNGAVLYPTYRQPANDELARRQLQKVFPDDDIVGIDCTALIRQHGSLHCCTMQYPAL